MSVAGVARRARDHAGLLLDGEGPARPLALVVALTGLGMALRVAVAGQSLFADELSTYTIISTNDLWGVLSSVHGDTEITPPLYFVATWLTTRIDLSPELLRAPSLLAGGAAIPLTYLLGLRTVGRTAALVAATLTALSPFMIFYSAEARGYQLTIVLVLLSTLALLAGTESGRTRWWLAYAACSCAAVYTHYTTVFPLSAQLLWLLWAHPERRRAALLANCGAVGAFLPWMSGLIADFRSPTTDIVNALGVLSLHSARVTVEHWSIGYPLVFPNTPLRVLPGYVGLALLALALAVSAAGVARRIREHTVVPLTRLDKRLALAALVVGPPAGMALASAVGTNLVSVRHLAASWPAFALLLSALVTATPQKLRIAAVSLIIASFAVGGARMLEPRFQRPEYEGAAAFIDRTASSGDVVIDVTNLSPAALTAMDVAFEGSRRLFYIGRPRVQFDRFKVLAAPPPPAQVVRQAAAAAAGRRIFVVASETVFARSDPLRDPLTAEVVEALPSGYRRVEVRSYAGILRLAVVVYATQAAPRE